MNTTFRYRAFISYSHRDEQHARALHRWLERYRVPQRLVRDLALPDARLRPVFRDRDELRVAGSLTQELRGALLESAFLIVLCSPSSAESHWVNEEVLFFKSRYGADRVLCVIVDGEGGISELSPPALRHEVSPDGEMDLSAPLEPLAADIRRSGDGPRLAYLKIAAGLLDCPLDALVQREHARRMRVLSAIALASVLGMLLMAGLTTYAFQQRAIAITEAETSRQVVDFLVGLFEVSNPATQNPRTITALEILDKGTQDIRNSFADRPEVKGVMLSTMGEVYYNLGLYKESRELLESGVTLFQPDSLRALGSRIVLANLATRQDRYDEAEAAYRDIARMLEQEFPDAQLPRANVERGLGVLEYSRSRPAEAEQHYRAAIAGYRRAGNARPLLARSLEGLAGVLMDIGRNDEAEELLLEAIGIREDVLGTNHMETGAAYHNLAVLRLGMQRYDEAVASTRSALGIFSATLEEDHPHVATARMTLGRSLHGAGEAAQGIESLQSAVQIGEAVYGRANLFNAVARVYLARARSSAGDAARALADLDAAEAIYREVIGDDDAYIGDLFVNRAVVQYAAGDVDAALASCRTGLERLERTGDAGLRSTYGKECDDLLARERDRAPENAPQSPQN